MLCDICGKNQATVHLTEIIDEQMTELHLCEECAREKGAQMEQHFGLADLLAGLADFGKQFEMGKESDLKCAACGLSYLDFKKIGRLGCSECYQYFKELLSPLLKRIHGACQHVGLVPLKAQVKAGKTTAVDLEQLKGKLQELIHREAFEEAACLRDQIRELEKAQAQNKKRKNNTKENA
jgi:protein arginine kinase activator